MSEPLFSPVNGQPRPANATAALGLWLATRPARSAQASLLGDVDHVEAMVAHGAVAHGAIELRTPVELRVERDVVSTTVGRVLLWRALGPHVPLATVNRPVTPSVRARLIERCAEHDGLRAAETLAYRLEAFGRACAAAAAFSIGLEDLELPARKAAILEEARVRAEDAWVQYDAGLYTTAERDGRVYDAFVQAEAELDHEIDRVSSDTPLGALRSTGICTVTELRRAVAMVGAVERLGNAWWSRSHITTSLREGLAPHELVRSSMGARSDLVDRELHGRAADRLCETLIDALGHLRVTERDCRNDAGRSLAPITQEARLLATVGERAWGRIAAEPILTAHGDLVLPAGAAVDGAAREAIDAALAAVSVRSLLQCRTREGVCAACYGHDLRTRAPVRLGTRVGLVAARSIAAGFRRLNDPLFRVGSASSWGPALDCAERAGVVRWESIDAAPCLDDHFDRGVHVAMGEGRILVMGEDGEVLERFRVQRGDRIHAPDGAHVARRTPIVRRWGLDLPVLADLPIGATAIVRWSDVRSADEESWRARKIGALVLEITEADGSQRTRRVELAEDAYVQGDDGREVRRGVTLARHSVEWSTPQEGRGGLLSLLGAPGARPGWAVVAEHDGVVRTQDRHTIEVHAADGSVQRRRTLQCLQVRDGDPVRAGDALTWGPRRPRDLLALWGRERLGAHLLEALVCCLAQSRVLVADVHLELVVRAMLRWSRVHRRTVPQHLAPEGAPPMLLGVGAMARRARRRT
jgi:DNA-directed RNA polymerase subunit beta'